MKDTWEGTQFDCPSCRGTGVYKAKRRIPCEKCGGTGKIGGTDDFTISHKLRL